MLTKLTINDNTKAECDRIADGYGGIPQHRLMDAMLECWNRATEDDRIDCIRSTAMRDPAHRGDPACPSCGSGLRDDHQHDTATAA